MPAYLGEGGPVPHRARMLREVPAATEPSKSKEAKSREGVGLVGEVDRDANLSSVLKFPSGKR